jgi:hypothetical protein
MGPEARQNQVLRRCTAMDYYGIDIHKRPKCEAEELPD